MSMYLNDVFGTSPGFKSSVNILDDFHEEHKVGSYLPTKFGREAFRTVAGGLRPTVEHRQTMVVGNYGTGKSHLAAAIGQYFASPWPNSMLTKVMDKIKVADPGLYESLQKERENHSLPFLVVRIVGYGGGISKTLLSGLMTALADNEWSHIKPETAYVAALKRISELETDYNHALSALESAVQGTTWGSIAAIKAGLEDGNPQALEDFEEIHPSFSNGAPFPYNHGRTAAEVYRAVVKQLREHQLAAGIMVIWDEFGANLRQLVQYHDSQDYMDLQDVLEACAGSRQNQLHFLVLTHRSFSETLRISGIGESHPAYEDLLKIKGRFRELPVEPEDGEIYRLMQQIIVASDSATTTSYLTTHQHWLEISVQRASDFGLFPIAGQDLLNVVGKGCYPLHPAATYCLPILSAKVAQNERTLWWFLADEGSNTLSDYLRTTAVPADTEPIPALTVDRLWDFFADDIKELRATQKIHEAYVAAHKPTVLHDRVLKAVAILFISGGKLPPTEEHILFALGALDHEREAVRQVLADLSQGLGRTLIKQTTGQYVFSIKTGDLDLEGEIRDWLDRHGSEIDTLGFIRRQRALTKPTNVTPTQFNAEMMADRHFYASWVAPSKLTNAAAIASDQTSHEGDGVAYYVLATTSAEVEAAKAAALGITDRRVLVAVPSVPVALTDHVRRLVALEGLRRDDEEHFGVEGSMVNEWQPVYESELATVHEMLNTRYKADADGPAWYSAGVEYLNIKSASALGTLASDAIKAAYSKTIKFSHEELVKSNYGRDGQRSYRQLAMDTLFRPTTGLQDTAELSHRPTQKVIDGVWKKPGFLKRELGIWVMGRPQNNAPASEAWTLVEQFLRTATPEAPKSFRDVVTQLKSPPFGTRSRIIPLLLSAVMACHAPNLRIRNLEGQVQKLAGELLEGIVETPEDYRVTYLEVSEGEQQLATAFEELFGVSQDSGESDRYASISEAVAAWAAGVSNYARQLAQQHEVTRAVFHECLNRFGQANTSPRDLICLTFPRKVANVEDLATASSEVVAELIVKLTETKDFYDQALTNLRTDLLNKMREQFQAVDSLTAETVVTGVVSWYSNLPASTRQNRFGGKADVIMDWAKGIQPASLLDDLLRLPEQLINHPLAEWTVQSKAQFDGIFSSFLDQINGHASQARSAQEADTEETSTGGTRTEDTLTEETGTGETGTGETNTGESDTRESGIEESGTEEIGTGESGTEEIGTGGTGNEETGTEETGNEETGTEEIGTGGTGNEETGNEETGTEEIGTGESSTGGTGTGSQQQTGSHRGTRGSIGTFWRGQSYRPLAPDEQALLNRLQQVISESASGWSGVRLFKVLFFLARMLKEQRRSHG